jgi:predicted RNase H-like nuclease (RuvC/YqgF family)
MLIALIIVGGLTAMTAIAVAGDYLTKSKIAKNKADPAILKEYDRRIAELERRLSEQDAKIEQLESDVSFTNKLLSDK